MKNKYLATLKETLEDRKFNKKEIKEILSDYDQLYEDARASEKTDEEILELLGDPKRVGKEISYEYRWKNESQLSGKLITLMPFLSIIVFMIVGLSYNIWHPTWLVFLSIPIAAILLETKGFNRLISMSPFLSVIAFILLGHFYALWNPAWLIFLSVPMIALLNHKDLKAIILYELSFIAAIGFYLFMGYTYGSWGYGALGFILPFALGLYYKDIKILIDINYRDVKRKEIIFLGIILGTAVSFLALGILINAWVYAWQLFLFIPISAIIIYDKFTWVAISPFISVMLFFSLGYFFSLWSFSWLAFLLIPMTGILYSNE